MADFEEKLSKIREDQFEPIPDHLASLYHYTDVNGLQGIIGSNQWYATHYLYLNDIEEIICGDNLVKEEVQNRITKEKNQSICEAFEQSIRSELSPTIQGIYDVYIVSFSQEKDLLDQWRAYGDDGSGYAIGINPHLVDPSLKFLKVEYLTDEQNQRDRIKQILDKVADALDRSLANNLDNAERQKMISETSQYLARIRIDFSLSLKHACFQNEREWRVICEHWKHLEPFREVCYRQSAGSLIPFIKLDFHSRDYNDLLPLREIMIGPKHRNREDLVKKSLEMQLRTKGYKQNKNPTSIRVSQLPYQ